MRLICARDARTHLAVVLPVEIGSTVASSLHVSTSSWFWLSLTPPLGVLAPLLVANLGVA